MIMMMMMIIPPFYRKKKFHNESKTKLSVFILFFDVKSFPTKTFELSCKIYLFIQIRQKDAYNNSNINKKNSYIQHILRINIRWPINGVCVFHIKRYLKLCLSCKFFFLLIHSFICSHFTWCQVTRHKLQNYWWWWWIQIQSTNKRAFTKL